MNSKGHDQTVQVIGAFTVGRFASLRNLQGQNKGSDKIEWIHRLAEPLPITDILSYLVFFFDTASCIMRNLQVQNKGSDKIEWFTG